MRTLVFYYRGRLSDGSGADYDIGGSALRAHVRVLERPEGRVFTLETSLPAQGEGRERSRREAFAGEWSSPLEALAAYAAEYGYGEAFVITRTQRVRIHPPGRADSRSAPT